MEMEKQSRIQKYKELREEMKEEVAINRHIDTTSVDEDDDFLAFIPKTKQEDINDTLMNPLSYETLDEDSNVQHALNEAKVNIGKEQFNTRLDILNRIKKEEIHEPRHMEEEHVYETKQEEVPKKMSLLEKLAAMSPEEDAEELRKYEEETSIEQLVKSQKSEKKVKKEKVVVEEYDDEADEDDGEEENKVVQVLNYVILVFIFVFLVLIGFIVKQMFF